MRNWTAKERRNWLALLHSIDERNLAIALNILISTDEALEEFVLAAHLRLLMLNQNTSSTFDDFHLFAERYAQNNDWKAINDSAIFLLLPQSKHHPILDQYREYSLKGLLNIYEPYHQYFCQLLPLHDFYKKLLLDTAINYTHSRLCDSPTLYSRDDVIPVGLHLLFDSVLEHEPKNAMALFHKAYFYQNICKDFRTSIQLFQQFIAIHPNLKIASQDTLITEFSSDWTIWCKQASTVRALDYLGLAYYELGYATKALPYFQQAYDLGIRGNDPSIPFFHLANLLWKQQNALQKALNIIETGINITKRSYPTSTQKSLLLCQLWELAGDITYQVFEDWKTALGYYQKGLEEQPKNLALLAKRLKIVVHEQKDYSRGESLCKQMLKLSKNYHVALYYQEVIKRRKNN